MIVHSEDVEGKRSQQRRPFGRRFVPHEVKRLFCNHLTCMDCDFIVDWQPLSTESDRRLLGYCTDVREA